MDAILGKGSDILFNYGVLGVFLATSLIVNWRLWIAYQHSMDQRLAEAKETIRVVEGNTTALDNLAEVVRAGTRRNGR